VYFDVRWEQPGPLPGQTQSNSTVALWRYNFGVVSITGRNRWDRRGSCDGPSIRRCFLRSSRLQPWRKSHMRDPALAAGPSTGTHTTSKALMAVAFTKQLSRALIQSSFFAVYKAQRADFFRNLLVDPINNACSEVEWCQVPLIQVNLRVGELAQANAKMMSRVKVEPTCDCPLAAKVFDWLRVFCSRNRRI
jgi:hypothetical protein